MTQTAAVVRKQVVVQAPIDRASAVSTGRFGDFKPAEHNLLATPIAETLFEPRVGGNIVDRVVDGSELPVGPDPGLCPARPCRGVGHRYTATGRHTFGGNLHRTA